MGSGISTTLQGCTIEKTEYRGITIPPYLNCDKLCKLSLSDVKKKNGDESQLMEEWTSN